MSNVRTPQDSFRPRRRTLSSNDDSAPSSPVTPSHPFTAIPDAASETASIVKGHHPARRPPSRINRTFEEIQVEKLVMTEEWYEELECGICSHVLGAPQALVPCGHTFCGPCAWQWIRGNKNPTCPHCRMEVLEGIHFVPNIIVDQIIERKLRALTDGPQKMDMQIDRQEKIEAWKLRLASLPSTKPAARRPRGLDDIMMNLLDYTAPADRSESHRRRASRHYAELGAPLLRPPAHLQMQMQPQMYAERINDDIWGGRIEEEPDSVVGPRLDVRRMREHMLWEHVGGLRSLSEENEPAPLPRRERDSRPRGGGAMVGPRSPAPPIVRSPGPPSNIQAFPVSAEPTRHQNPPAAQHHTSSHQFTLGRPTPLRSTILAARQARGRTNGGGSRDQPLVDSE